MPCCCTSVYRLCDFVICESDIVLPIAIPADGEYTLELDFLQNVIRKTAMLTAGDNATFPATELNEHFTYVGHVKGPAGETINFTVDSVLYDCIEFTTKRSV